MEPSDFIAPFITREQAWAAADTFRQAHGHQDVTPVDVLDIAEIQLGISVIPIPGLSDRHRVVAAISPDFQRIYLDNELYIDDRLFPRMRFSIAHELGHFVLHSNVYQMLGLSTIEDWYSFRKNIPEEEIGFFEYHAYEFAGRLLVQRDMLEARLREAVMRLSAMSQEELDFTGDAALRLVAKTIAPSFEVSHQTILKRMERENLSPPT